MAHHYNSEHNTRDKPRRRHGAIKFAACLLMPMRDIRDYLHNTGVGNLPERISKGHSVFQVSRDAFLSRISDSTPINLFEVVSPGANAKVRRSFFSTYRREEQARQALDELLDDFHRTNDLPKRPVVVDNYQVQATLTRQSHTAVTGWSQ